MSKSTGLWRVAEARILGYSKRSLVIVLAIIIIILAIISIIIIRQSNQEKAERQPQSAVARQFQNRLPNLKQKSEKNPDNFDAQRDYAVALYATGNIKKAEDQYERALRLKKDATTYNNLANAQRDLGNYDDAVSNYKKAIEANPKLINPYTNLANIQLYSLNKTDDAIDTYRQGLKELPNDPNLQVLLALAYEKKGDLPSAKQTLRSAQATHPEDQNIQANLARLE